MIINEKYANLIFDILVKESGANEKDRESFLSLREEITEFRFCGKLGFGGKFWNSNDKWYISCYKEDESTERNKIIKKVNKILADLRSNYLINE